MEDRRARTNHACAEHQHGIGAGMREHDQPDQRAAHAGHQRKGLRTAICKDANQRLQQRRGQLKGQRDQADLREIETIG